MNVIWIIVLTIGGAWLYCTGYRSRQRRSMKIEEAMERTPGDAPQCSGTRGLLTKRVSSTSCEGMATMARPLGEAACVGGAVGVDRAVDPEGAQAAPLSRS